MSETRFCPWCLTECRGPVCLGADCDGAATRTSEDVNPYDSAPFVGRILDQRYRVTRAIAHAGMGAVYKAYDRITDEMVFIKFLATDRDNPLDPRRYRRFLREARILYRLGHPHTVAFLDFEGADPRSWSTQDIPPYLVMER